MDVQPKSLTFAVVGWLFPQAILNQDTPFQYWRWVSHFSRKEMDWLHGLRGEILLRWVIAWLLMMIGSAYAASYIGVAGVGVIYLVFMALMIFQFICYLRISALAQGFPDPLFRKSFVRRAIERMFGRRE